MDIAIAPTDVQARLSALSDENRLRILALLDQNEFTVTELTSVVQLPQSTVSRHLKVLSDEGWIRWRQDGTSRHYRMPAPDGESGELWRVVRGMLSGTPWVDEDAERARSVLAARRGRAQEFFSEAAEDWDRLRAEMFGARTELSALFGLLDPTWTVGDLGSGTGAFSETVAPFVARVVAVDRSPEMLAASRSRLAELDNVEIREGELEALPIESGVLDVAVLLLVLHYVVEPKRALQETYRALRKGGLLVVVDMREHSREDYRHTMGHAWTGFGEAQMAAWSAAAGFDEYRHRGLVPDTRAAGPLLFVGTARK